ncbi:MAG: hypothetical protein LUE25_08580 [Clostridiales bacterium]|nr:hypothetical protein [Clostridiales bacterium]
MNRMNIFGEWRREDTGGESQRFAYPAPAGAVGRYSYGFEVKNDSALDAVGWYGFTVTFRSACEEPCLLVTAEFYGGETLSREIHVSGAGERTVDVKLSDFPYPKSKPKIWRELTAVEFSGNALVTAAEIKKGRVIAVEAPVRGISTGAGGCALYSVKVSNCTGGRVTVSAEQIFDGWESFECEISEPLFTLGAFCCREISVSVKVPEGVPAGGHEETLIMFTPDGDSASRAEIKLITVSELPHPFIYKSADGWRETAEKIAGNEKFRGGYERYKRRADEWVVPRELPLGERDYCFDTRQEEYVMSSAYMYSLTGNIAYAEKVAEFFGNFTNPEDGYPVKKKGCSQSFVQEGHFLQHLALAYDMILPSGVLSREDKAAIEGCFRIYMDILDIHIKESHMSNWVLSEVTGAIYCAMAVGDLERVLRFVYGEGGAVMQLRHGLFPDGWWYEGSVSYNTWVSSMYIHIAHALIRYGIDITHERFPLFYGREVDPTLPSDGTKINFGMYNERWGGFAKNYVTIKDLFDAPVRFLDWRGVLFGINDSAERRPEPAHFGSTYELAYHYYRDPAYIGVIEALGSPDPIFGEAEYPEGVALGGARGAYSDNIGIVMLRGGQSDPRERIQAVLRCGSHGYAHGHFDRTELLSLMRYGRSFYNPEHVWWGYGHFMYKFYVQTSGTKNMVVVDEKMQVPSDSKRILFYTGERFSAAAVTARTKWSYPPFGGMRYTDDYAPTETLCERAKFNGCGLDSYDAAPYGELTEFTEPIKSTRVMATLDDAVVIFDYIAGKTCHRYESLLQIKGLLGLFPVGDESHVEYTGHDGQKSRDVRSDAQFVTDVERFRASGTSEARFRTIFGRGGDLRGTRAECCEDGELNLDVYTAYPREYDVSVGLAAEDHGIKIPYEVKVTVGGEVKLSADGGAWILGDTKIDASFEPTREIALEIFCPPLLNEQKYPRPSRQGLFFGGARVVYEDGTTATVSDCALEYENIDKGHGIGRDYEGGRVLIRGTEYPDAIPASPADHDLTGRVIIKSERPITGICGVFGADAFPGDEAQRRRTFSVGVTGRCARFITVIEPHEGEGVIACAEAPDENTVTIRYKDGREETLTVCGIDTDAPSVTLAMGVYRETAAGKG